MAGNFAGGSLRPLLPRPLPVTSDSAAITPRSQAPVLAPKRTVIKAACEACRRRKVKCDAKRPSCSPCVNTDRDCEYRTVLSESDRSALKREQGELKRKLNELETSHSIFDNVFRAIQSRPEAEAAAIFQRIREGADSESIMRHINAGDMLLQLHLCPETRYRYVFPYRTAMPASLQCPNNPYLGSLVYEGTGLAPTSEQQALSPSTHEKYRTQYLKPYHAAKMEDPRLDSVKPSMWTSVSTDDDMMRMLLRSYFIHEYDWLTVFHKDHFLDDMVAGSNRFCSSLLVNAVLALGSHCCRDLPDRIEYWNPRNLGYKFFAEAKRLWEMEQNAKSSLTTLQAGLLMCLLFNMCGVENIGCAYEAQAVAIAYDLKLFNPSTHIKSNRMRQSRDFTLWCLFCFQSFFCYSFFKAPFIREPPNAPLPDPKQNPAWYGEFWLKYPLSRTLIPKHFGQLFKAKCEFCIILNRVAFEFFSKESGKASQRPYKTVVNFVRHFMVWHSSLPEPLGPKKIVFPSQYKLHLHYCNVMMNLCQRLVDSADPIPGLENPRALLANSEAYFETLMRLYYLRHGFEAPDMPIMQDLVVFSYMAMTKMKSLTSSSATSSLAVIGDARATLILAAKGLHDQGHNYYMSRVMYDIFQKQMSSEDAELMGRFVDEKKEEREVEQLRTKHMQSQSTVNIVKRTKDSEMQRLSNMVKEYADMAAKAGTTGRIK